MQQCLNLQYTQTHGTKTESIASSEGRINAHVGVKIARSLQGTLHMKSCKCKNKRALDAHAQRSETDYWIFTIINRLNLFTHSGSEQDVFTAQACALSDFD